MQLVVYSNANDGRVLSSNATYATARSGSNLSAPNTETSSPVGQYANVPYYIDEMFLWFDTSVLGAAATPTVATLAQAVQSTTCIHGFTLEAYGYNWGDTLTTANWLPGASIGTGMSLIASRAVGTTESTNTYYPLTSTAAFLTWLNLTGNTWIFLASADTRTGTVPTSADYQTFYMADNSGTTYDPKLTITYTLTGISGGIEVDDTDASVVYTGSHWSTSSNASDYGGSIHYNTTGGVGEKAVITFTGTRIQWIGTMNTTYGIASVQVDSGSVAYIDLYSPSALYQQVLFDSGPISAGSHTLTITCTGTKNPSAIAYYVGVDSYIYAVGTPTVTGISGNIAGPTAGGTTGVVITGTNFTGTSGAGGVKFGATNATSYVVNSNTQITAVSPAHAVGAVDITVTNNGQTSSTSGADQFTYVAAPTVTSVTPNSGPITGGNSIVVTGTHFTGATVVYFQENGDWQMPGTGLVVTDDSHITITPPNTLVYGQNWVDVRVTTPGGQSAIVAGDVYTFQYNDRLPTVSPPGAPGSLYGTMTPRRTARQKGW